MVKIVRKSRGSISKIVFIGQKPIFPQYCIQCLKMEFKFKYTILITKLKTTLANSVYFSKKQTCQIHFPES